MRFLFGGSVSAAHAARPGVVARASLVISYRVCLENNHFGSLSKSKGLARWHLAALLLYSWMNPHLITCIIATCAIQHRILFADQSNLLFHPDFSHLRHLRLLGNPNGGVTSKHLNISKAQFRLQTHQQLQHPELPWTHLYIFLIFLSHPWTAEIPRTPLPSFQALLLPSECLAQWLDLALKAEKKKNIRGVNWLWLKK